MEEKVIIQLGLIKVYVFIFSSLLIIGVPISMVNAGYNNNLRMTCPADSSAMCNYFITVPASLDDTAVFKLYSHYMVAESQIRPYGEFKGDIQVIHADTDGDNKEEIITVPKRGGGPHVRIWELPYQYRLDFSPILDDEFFAYDNQFHGGLNVVTGDYDGDGTDSITISPLSDGGPNIRTFRYSEHGYTLDDWFFAYSEDFHGGVTVHSGDVDGDGKDELIIGSVQGAAPIKIYDWNGVNFDLKNEFMPFSNDFTDGVRIKIGNVSKQINQENEEIIITPNYSANPEIKIYSWDGDQFRIVDQFMAYGDNSSIHLNSGVDMQLGNVAGDGKLEIVTFPLQENIVPLRVWQEGGDAPLHLNFRPIAQKTIYEMGSQGISVGLRNLQPDRFPELDGDGHDEIIVASKGGVSPIVQLYRFHLYEPTRLEVLNNVLVFSPEYRGGIHFDGIM
ncbi:MAG: hypothetical protein WC693_02610 [Patescibacteria group bacterium]|jgi:hypothetical protein